MDREPMDRILAEEDGLEPSSGFLAAVMDRVNEEAAAPPRIPFPWRRAVPGVITAVAVLVWAVVEMARYARVGGVSLALPHVNLGAAMTPAMQQAGWVALALALAWAGWKLARRLSA